MEKKITIIIALVFIFVSCNKPVDEIDSQCSSGVVLIQNASYYELMTPQGSIYFSHYDSENDQIDGLQFDEDSIEFQLSYGTGFFISDDGQIATNKHVVSPRVTEKEAQNMLKKLLGALQSALSDEFDEWNQLQQQVRIQMRYAYEEDNSNEYLELDALDDAIIEKKNSLAEAYQVLGSIDHRDAELLYHNNISIAYNNTYVTNMDDFEDCIVKKVAENDDEDIAIIQLKNKHTPSDKYVFELSSENPLDHYTLFENIMKLFGGDKNDHLCMIGFNLGPTLAITEEGIKSQINEGTISQRSANRIMYSIPSLHGSSGSPVLNSRGQLVAINFAGLNNTQGFNYGIREDVLYNLCR